MFTKRTFIILAAALVVSVAALATGVLVVSPTLAADRLPRAYSGSLLVTGVSDSDITATSNEDLPVTVHTDGQTVFSKATPWERAAVGPRATNPANSLSSPASLADVKTDLRIAVQGQLTAPGVIQATRVQIVPARRGGKVTGVTGNTITVEARAAGATQSQSIVVGDSTTYLPANLNLGLANVVPSVRIQAIGFLDSSGNLVASQVQIQPSTVGGTVTAFQENTITVQQTTDATDGQTRTARVTVTGSTKYLKGPRGAATRADVTVGSRISAMGYRDQNGGLTATTVRVEPARPAAPRQSPTPTPKPGSIS